MTLSLPEAAMGMCESGYITFFVQFIESQSDILDITHQSSKCGACAFHSMQTVILYLCAVGLEQ